MHLFPPFETIHMYHITQEYISRKLVQWGKADEFKKELADCRKKPNAYFGYAVSFNVPISEAEIEQFVEDARLDREEDQ